MKGKFFLVVFLIFVSTIVSAQDFKVLSSTSSSLTIEYLPEYLDTSKVAKKSDDYLKIALSSSNLEPTSDPEIFIPTRYFNVGIPSKNGNKISIINKSFSVIQGKPEFADAIVNDKVNEIVLFGESGFSRDLLVQNIKVYPVQYNSVKNETRLYNRIVFQINFGSPQFSTKTLTNIFYKGQVINFDVAKNWGKIRETKLKKTSPSVLAEGTWYKFEAPVEGIYKITRNQLDQLGIDADEVDPRTIKIYNNGGKQLPENPNEDRPVDLTEIAIMIEGENDGSFDSGDEIIFYGRGTDFWEYDENEKEIVRRKHDFSKQNYFFITSGGNQGKRIENLETMDNPDYTINKTTAFLLHEEDNINLLSSGRMYVENEEYSVNVQSRTYMNKLDDIILSDGMNYKFAFVNESENYTRLNIEESGELVYNTNIPGGSQYVIGRRRERDFSVDNVNLEDERSVLKFTFDAKSIETKGYLDYFELNYQRELKALDDEIIFYSDTNKSIKQFDLSNFSNSLVKVFDVTEHDNIGIIKDTQINGGECSFAVNENGGKIKKYIAVTDEALKSISNPQKVENTNIRGFSEGSEYVIIANKKFKSQVERFASYRENEAKHKINTSIYYIDELYNEFSGGLIDPTAIRDFLIYAYNEWTEKPYFVLLFGDGSYDIYNKTGDNRNYIPTFQTVESLSEINSYPNDTYYSLIAGNDRVMDVALGRFCVETENEAEIVVNKIIEYESNVNRGTWRNNITLLADDGWTTDDDDGSLHTKQSEALSRIIPASFDQNKIYLAAYPEQQVGSGRRKPEVNDALVRALNDGTLIFNYTGHGNPRVLAHEQVFVRDITIPKLKNEKYFFLTAATCDFAKYDDLSAKSSTEELFIGDKKGSIGAFASSRLVYASSNSALNNDFYSELFKRDQNFIPLPIGIAYVKAKNANIKTNSEKYHLLADPYLRLNIPVVESVIDSVNGQVPNTSLQLSALSKVSVKGHVNNSDGSVNENYTGEAIITVFDSEKEIELEEINYSMKAQGGVLFRGRVSINSGQYEAKFVMPKDISYENKSGKIVTYVYNSANDGIGFTENVKIGGTDTTLQNDKVGPEIEIFYDDVNYESTYLVNPDFELIVKLKDETGLNTTGTGIGHKLEGILNEDKNSPIDFSNFFIGDKDSEGKKGTINYNFNDLEEGEYKIEVKAWDVFNNPNVSESYFSVVQGDGLVVRNVVNYPNPFSSQTHFTFQHNLNNALDVEIKIYTIAGRLIKEIERLGVNERFVKIPWNGRDNDGDLIANGTYLYKLKVKSIDGEYKENILGKLAVIR